MGAMLARVGVALLLRDIAVAIVAGALAALAYGLPSQSLPLSAAYLLVLASSLAFGGRCGMLTIACVLIVHALAKGVTLGWIEAFLFTSIASAIVWLASSARQPRGGAHDFFERFQGDRQQRALLDNLPKMVWIAEPDGTTRYRNRYFYEYSGLSGDEDWRAIVHPEDRADAAHAWDESLSQARPLNMEVRLRRASDGHYRWHLVNGVPITGDDGRVQCWYGAGTDIEDQKRAMETLEQANQRISRFLAVLSHELRNPMAGMSSACELLLRSDVDEERRRDALVLLHRQNLHLRRMVDDLLDIARVTQGKVELRRERIEVVDLMNEVHHDNLSVAQAHGVILDRPSFAARCHMQGDQARLRQVLDNLVSNAIKASAEGQHVRMAVKCLGGETIISVEDDGQGFDPGFVDRVFQPFVQAAAWQSRGLGLGLSIVKHLVELHGGYVVAHSDGPGLGATFKVHLPCTGSDAMDDHRPAPARAMPQVEGAGVRVLLVDDEIDNAEALRTLLSLEGLDVSVAGNADDALTLSEQQPFDVVLCDLELKSGPSGYDIARALSANATAPWLIAYSGYGQQSDIEETQAAGFHRHLVKPASLEDILAAIEEGLRSNRRPSHADPTPTVTI